MAGSEAAKPEPKPAPKPPPVECTWRETNWNNPPQLRLGPDGPAYVKFVGETEVTAKLGPEPARHLAMDEYRNLIELRGYWPGSMLPAEPLVFEDVFVVGQDTEIDVESADGKLLGKPQLPPDLSIPGLAPRELACDELALRKSSWAPAESTRIPDKLEPKVVEDPTPVSTTAGGPPVATVRMWDVYVLERRDGHARVVMQPPGIEENPPSVVGWIPESTISDLGIGTGYGVGGLGEPVPQSEAGPGHHCKDDVPLFLWRQGKLHEVGLLRGAKFSVGNELQDGKYVEIDPQNGPILLDGATLAIEKAVLSRCDFLDS